MAEKLQKVRLGEFVGIIRWLWDYPKVQRKFRVRTGKLCTNSTPRFDIHTAEISYTRQNMGRIGRGITAPVTVTVS